MFLTKLKEIYLFLLANEAELIALSETVISVVKLLWSLKLEAPRELFSKFYEPTHLDFLFKYTNLHNKFVELKKLHNLENQEYKSKFGDLY